MSTSHVKPVRIIAAFFDLIIYSAAVHLVGIAVAAIAGIENPATYILWGLDANDTADFTQTFAFMAVSLTVGFTVYAFVPRWFGGQTIGKRLFRIKAVDEAGNNPSLPRHALRAIMIWDVYIGILAIFVLLQSEAVYAQISYSVNTVITLSIFLSIFMIFAAPRGRGLHDYLAKTDVVSVVSVESDPFVIDAEDTPDVSADPFADEKKPNDEQEDDPWEL